jgi:hypothetical protein
VQGQASLVTSLGDLAFTWRHRHRLTQVGIIPQDDPSAAAPEGGYTLSLNVGIPATEYVFAANPADPTAFQILGSAPGCPATIGMNTGTIVVGTTIRVYVQLATGTIWYGLNTVPIPDDAIPLWDVPAVAVTAGGGPAVGPGTPIDLRPLTQTILTGQTGASTTLTAAQRLAASTNGLLPASLAIKTVNGAQESGTQTTSLTVMTGLGMTLGQYLGGIQS